MFGQMRQLPEEVVKDWDKGQPEEHPFQKRMRDVRLAKEAKQRFVYLCVVGVSLIVGFLIGHFSPLLALAAFVALVTVALVVQSVIWVRRELQAREVAQKIDEGIKVIEPKDTSDENKDTKDKNERAA